MILLTIKELNVFNSIVSDHYEKFETYFINELLPSVVHRLCKGKTINLTKKLRQQLRDNKIIYKKNKKWYLDAKYALKYYE